MTGPEDIPVRITWDRETFGGIFVGGVDISPLVLDARLRMPADGLPELALTLEALAVEAAVSDARVHIEAFGPATVAALTAAGWTPPAVTE